MNDGKGYLFNVAQVVVLFTRFKKKMEKFIDNNEEGLNFLVTAI